MARDEGLGGRRSKSLRRTAETKARYQDVVRGAQQRIAQDYADDPLIGRVDPGPKASRNKGIDRGLVEATGIPQLVSDVYWTATHPVERLKGEERAADPQMIFPGLSGKLTGSLFGKAKGRVAPAKPAPASLPKAKQQQGKLPNPTKRERIFADVVARPDKYVFHGTPGEAEARGIEDFGLDAGTVAGHWGDTLDYAQGGYVLVFRKSDFGPDFAVTGQKPVAVFMHRDFSPELKYGKRSEEMGDGPPSPEDADISWMEPSVRNYIGSEFPAAAPAIIESLPEAKPAALAAPTSRKPGAYVSKNQEYRGSVPDEAWEQGYLYHRTTPNRLTSIRKSGLTPAQPAGGNPAGVYFANHPLQAVGLAWKYKNGAYLRVRRDKVPDLEERAFGESLSARAVAPEDLEYLGKDGKWYSVTDPPLSPEEQIISAMPEARRLRERQERGYTKERSKRFAKAEEAMQVGGEAGYQAALRELKGELPKLKFGALENFDQKAVDELFTHIQKMDVSRGEKLRTMGGLRKVLDGQTPQRSEILALERAFGPEVADQILASVTFWKQAKQVGLSVVNIPRSVIASFDLSAPFRQGLVLGARHPVMFAKEFPTMLKAFKSEGAYDDVMAEIGERSSFGSMQRGKLALTDLEGIGSREEAFMSNYAETLTGGKRFSPIRMSGRAYTAFLNKFRADAFDNYLRMAAEEGRDITDEHLLRSIGSWVNHATGRGTIKNLETSMPALTAVFFSPRLIASRLQLLNPAYYARLDPFARKQALAGARNLLGAISLTLYLAKQAGADVGLDPRSSDFGKIKVGDTRVDIAGGFQQYVVNAYRVIQGETVSSTTGEVAQLEGGFAKPSRADIFMNFAENKLAPVPQFGTDILKNENFEGEPFDPKRDTLKLFTPLGVGSTIDAYQESGPKTAAATAGLGGIGFGVLTYGDDEDSGGSSKSLRSGKGGRKKSLRSSGGGRRKSLRRK